MQCERVADFILTIQCLDCIGLGIQEQTPGLVAIPKNCLIAKGIIEPELIRQSDRQQQQQQQQRLLGFRWLLCYLQPRLLPNLTQITGTGRCALLVAMPWSTEPPAAQVSIEEQVTVMELIDLDLDNIGNDQLR